MAKAFASKGDLSEKNTSFTQIGEGLYAFTAEGDPNSGVIIGDDSVMIVEAQATPRLARKVIDHVREVTDKPISHLVLTHYHAVRVLGASAFGTPQVIMSDKARAMVVERGQEDWDSEFERFPRLFQGHDEIPGLTWPTTTFNGKMSVYLGKRRIDIMQVGRAHTAGDCVIHVPDQNVMFTGDIVEYHSACYCGDGHFADWGNTIEAIRAFDVDAIAPGRGDALIGKEMVNKALDNTKDFVKSTYLPAAKVALSGGSLKEAWDAVRAQCDPKFADYAIYEHCLPFNVARAYDEAQGIDTPRIWTAQRDRENVGSAANMSYTYNPFEYHAPPELSGKAPNDAPVVIVGAGPIGIAAAIDLALHGQKSIVLDDNNVVSVGSRAICWAKRTLEIFDRLGVAQRMLDKGVTWKVGRLFNGEKEVFNFDLLPEDGHKMPAFINLQQYYVEEYLMDRAFEFEDFIDIRFKNKVTAITQETDQVTVTVDTPDGTYTLQSQYLLACDGANSDIRRIMNLAFEGQSFEEQFLIADIKMTADFPNERWFWFNPPFHDGQTALLHKQPDDIYRIDLQLPLGADVDEAKKPENVIPRISRAVEGRPFELDWMSIYKFRCNRLEKFVHDRIIFVGDSAHVVSPFGARGGNGGIQDVDNLIWKLDLVLRGHPNALLKTYDEERIYGSDENILNSTRATHFMQPPTPFEKIFRDAVLDLAVKAPFARQMINSGRLSTPCALAQSSIIDVDPDAPHSLGLAAADAPVEGGYLLNHLGSEFKVLSLGCQVDTTFPQVSFPSEGILAQRYGKGVYLVRPDQHIAAYWPHAPSAAEIQNAHAWAIGIH